MTSTSLEALTSYKRQGYLEWDEYFMAVAFLSAQRSKDPRTQVGACIVNSDKKIVGIGYNGMPIGCHDDQMPWNRAKSTSKEDWLESKTPYVCHAELNAVLNKNLADVKGCSIYVALFPCNTCAQIIIQSRISDVIYYSDKYHDRPEFEASRRMFDAAGVKFRQFQPRQKKITIDFDLIETTPDDASGSSKPDCHAQDPLRLSPSSSDASCQTVGQRSKGAIQASRKAENPASQRTDSQPPSKGKPKIAISQLEGQKSSQDLHKTAVQETDRVFPLIWFQGIFQLSLFEMMAYVSLCFAVYLYIVK